MTACQDIVECSFFAGLPKTYIHEYSKKALIRYVYGNVCISNGPGLSSVLATLQQAIELLPIVLVKARDPFLTSLTWGKLFHASKRCCESLSQHACCGVKALAINSMGHLNYPCVFTKSLITSMQALPACCAA